MIGVLVALDSNANPVELAIFGRTLAMHVAASNPVAVDSKGVDEAAIKRERDVLSEKAKASGKPANVIEKIVDSGLKTYFKEVTMLEQPYALEPSKSVAQAVKEVEGKLGSPIAIKGFVRYALGEGVEKQEQDFAAEVAAATRPN
jgi:elongation factor Ts